MHGKKKECGYKVASASLFITYAQLSQVYS